MQAACGTAVPDLFVHPYIEVPQRSVAATDVPTERSIWRSQHAAWLCGHRVNPLSPLPRKQKNKNK